MSSENKDADQLGSYCKADSELISAFVFAYAKVRFSHDVAHLVYIQKNQRI